MQEAELVKIIKDKLSLGVGGDNGDLSKTRQDLLDRYYGELYGNEKEGESKITTREVFETIEWAMPSIVRVFESGDRIMEFDAITAQDEQAAEQETDAVNHIYNKDNNGFVLTSLIIRSTLMNPNAYIKVYYEEKETSNSEQYQGLTGEQLALLFDNDDYEILAAEEDEQGFFNIELKLHGKDGKCLVKLLPEDEVTIDSNHMELDLDQCEFTCHHPSKTHSDLLLMGYNDDELEEAYQSIHEGSEESNRNIYDGEGEENESHKALRKYTYNECSMLLDWDGDGIAERRRVVMIGNKIFENEEDSYQPIASSSTILMPHKHTGYSLAQSVVDLQNLKTYFMRQLVNNMSRVNNPRTLATKGANLQDLLSNKTNGVVRIKQVGDVTTEPTSPIIGQVLPLLDLIDNQKEGRSGITRNSMGLDADVLSKSTEGAFMGALEKAEQRVEFIVRTLAETIFKSIFLKIHYLHLTYGKSKEMKINGQWVAVDPSEWRKRESLTVNVGLGLGSRDKKMMAARIIIAEQNKAIEMGLSDLIDPNKIYNSRRLLISAAGEKNVDAYFNNPAMSPPKPPAPKPPDPNIIMLQQNAQIEAAKNQTKQMEMRQQGQIKSAELRQKAMESQAKLQQEQMLEARESQFKNRELLLKAEIESLKAAIQEEKNQNDANKTGLQSTIDELEIQIKNNNENKDRDIEKYKADLDAQTRIFLKSMDSEGNIDKPDMSLELVNAVVEKMNRPKRIIKDENGLPIGVETIE